jgi:integrase
MATLYKRDGSPFWWVYSVVGGKKIRESTGIRHDGKKKPCDTAIEIRSAIEARMARAKFGLAPILEVKSVKGYLAEYQNSLSDHRSTSTTRYEAIANHFIRWTDEMRNALDPLVINNVSDVTGSVAARYVDAFRGKLAGVTLDGYVKWLKAAWNEAKRRNYCYFEENPFLISVQKEKAEKRAFTSEEMRTLLAIQKPEWLRLAIRIGAYTGARIESIKALRWENIGWDLGVVNFPKSKTDAYSVAMHPELKAYLETCPLRASEGPVVGQEVLDKADAYVSQTFRDASKRAGVTGGTFHMFRHTFTTLCAEQGIDKRHSMAMTNHKDEGIHDAYTHVEASKLLPVIAKLKVA